MLYNLTRNGGMFYGYSDENETIIANVHWVCLIPHILLIFLMVGFITI